MTIQRFIAIPIIGELVEKDGKTYRIEEIRRRPNGDGADLIGPLGVHIGVLRERLIYEVTDL